jgi:hypothetical protein
MHHDQPNTHVISAIYHIASSDGSKPWPIVVEDYAGNTNSVTLKPGDLLLYESAKALHGRPTKFHGEWYTSVFLHYYPKDPEWSAHNRELDAHYATPPDWYETRHSSFPKLELIGSNMREPACPDYWCRLLHAIDLEGPGEYGQVLTAGGKTYPLETKDKKSAGGEL